MNPGDLVRITRCWSSMPIVGILLSQFPYKVGKRYDVYRMLCADGRIDDIFLDACANDSVEVLSEAHVQTAPIP